MFQLPESARTTRALRMAVALFISAVCALLGWHFIGNMMYAVAALPAPLTSSPPSAIARSLLPGVPGLYLWCIALAFLLFTLIKIDVPWKERHLKKFIFVMNVGRALLWLTVPVAALWLLGNLYVAG